MAARLKSFNKDQEFTTLFGSMTLGQVLDTFRDNLRAENAELKEEVQRWESEGGSPN
jgi:hypothetical protein